VIEFNDVLHLFATLGFRGDPPPMPTATTKSISGECGRDIQELCEAIIDDYFQKFKPWCSKSIEEHGEGEIRSRFHKLFEMGILDFQYEDFPNGQIAMILAVWDGEEYVDYRDIASMIDPFVIQEEAEDE
jgi:hypothetical protein